MNPLNLEIYTPQLNTSANLHHCFRTVEFLADNDNFYPYSAIIEKVVNNWRYSINAQYGQISIGYSTGNRQEAINFGIDKMSIILEYMLSQNIIDKIFKIPYVFDILSIDTNTGVNINSDLSEAVTGPSVFMPADWRADKRFVLNRVLLLFWFFPTVEYITTIGDVVLSENNVLSNRATKDKFNNEMYRTRQFYPFKIVDEGEIASETMILFK